MFVSYAEIYNEYVYDLLDKPLAKGQRRNTCKMAEDTNQDIYIKGFLFSKKKKNKEIQRCSFCMVSESCSLRSEGGSSALCQGSASNSLNRSEEQKGRGHALKRRVQPKVF